MPAYIAVTFLSVNAGSASHAYVRARELLQSSVPVQVGSAEPSFLDVIRPVFSS